MISPDDSEPPSTPLHDNAIFSDEPAQISSPPSSPPGFPWEQQKTTTVTPTRPSISAFSVLGKRKALTEVEQNARPAKKPVTMAESKPLSQMQISLGQKVQQKCKVCGMEYIRSSAEDRKLHDKYHKQSTEGYDVGKDFIQKAPAGTVFEGVVKADGICAVYCCDTAPRKRRAQAVLEIAQRELGAVPIPEQDIWRNQDRDGRDGWSPEPQYRAYMYVRKTKCLGFMLIERIKEARRVVELEAARKMARKAVGLRNGTALSILKARRQAAEEAELEAAKNPIELSHTSDKAKIGISRIWTSPTHRGQGIAVALLDAAIKHHSERVEKQSSVPVTDRQGSIVETHHDSAIGLAGTACEPLEKLRGKEDVAFSQPTAAGARLARKWFGKPYGWHVYAD